MRQLPEDLCPVPVHRSGQSRIMRDRRVLGQRQILRLTDTRGMESRGLIDDQPDTAPGARLVIGDQIDLSVREVEALYEGSIPSLMGS